ncbi:hypothetical protein ACOACO_17335 [Nocardioides sp. CPCC 205120]|uniref:hypothetical protein n=1 Tax=Nocardioides sp. CPCC 205120 TaxID=3406462 RepID=UPI003B511F54
MTSTPTRRTVLRATAWTAPVVAVAAAAPAFAASTAPTGIALRATNNATALTSRSRRVTFNVTNPTASPIVATISIPAVGPGAANPYAYDPESGWVLGTGPGSYTLTNTIAPMSDTPSTYFEWYSDSTTRETVTITASANFQSAAVTVTLPFDVPNAVARRIPSSDAGLLR